MSTSHSDSARQRWSRATAEERKAQTANAARVSRINAAKRRIAKAEAQIAKDRALIEELTSSV